MPRIVRKIGSLAGWALSVVVLTAVTQVGGVLLLALLPLFRWIDRRWAGLGKRVAIKLSAFSSLYLLVTFALLPPLAAFGGRVPLPVAGHVPLKPLTYLTCVLNRHYVRPAMREAAEAAAWQLAEAYPGAVLAYLDGNFPFWDGFPLLPHLSHDDGQKLDLAFCYVSQETGRPLPGEAPSPIGYGVYAGPLAGEVDQPRRCAEQGYQLYSLLYYFVPQGKSPHMALDAERTRALVGFFVRHQAIGKVFIEPHLKTRLNLSHAKVRFHGCHAVRHDDHLHVQLK